MSSKVREQVESILRNQYQPAAEEGTITQEEADRIAAEKAVVVAPILEQRRDNDDDSPVSTKEVWQANMLALKQDLERKIAPLNVLGEDGQNAPEPGSPQAQAAAIVASVQGMIETLEQLSHMDPESDRDQITEMIKNSPLEQMKTEVDGGQNGG